MVARTLAAYFISHGAGPSPYMLDQMKGAYDRLLASRQEMPQQLGAAPKAGLPVRPLLNLWMPRLL